MVALLIAQPRLEHNSFHIEEDKSSQSAGKYTTTQLSFPALFFLNYHYNYNIKMSSEFDVQVAFLNDVYKQASLDSQRLQSQIRILREQMQQLQKTIESKADGIMREMVPRIEQLEEKMSANWGSIQSMDRVSWQQLDNEKLIFSQCQNIVKQMETRIQDVKNKV